MMDFGLFHTWNVLYDGGKVPWDPCLRFHAPARNAARHRQDSEQHTMTRATAYQKRHAKAR